MISVTLVSTVATKDKYGDYTESTASQVYDKVRFAPRSSSERTDNTAPAIITGASLYRRGDFPVSASDTIVIAGQSDLIDGTWQVEGDPGYWGRGVEVAIKRTG